MNKTYYVYCFINKNWNAVFYVGKGSGDRYKDFHKRNPHITAILKNHDCETRILIDDLTEDEAYAKEADIKRKFICMGHPIIDSENISSKMKQRYGIEQAMEKGVVFGRPNAEYPDNWDEVIDKWQAGKITATKAMELTGTKRTTFYKLVKQK